MKRSNKKPHVCITEPCCLQCDHCKKQIPIIDYQLHAIGCRILMEMFGDDRQGELTLIT